MDAELYLRKYLRPVPGGAIAWRLSVFSHSEPFDPVELVDLAVDIAWEAFDLAEDSCGKSLEIRKSGSYMVFSINS